MCTTAQNGHLIHRSVNAAIVAIFVALIGLSYLRNINWDEFFYLSHVHAHLNGQLDRPMQTFHVHIFAWLGAIPGKEFGQIVAGRLFMVACLGITALSLHRIARHFADPDSATIAVLAFLASGFVLPYGASFRADPIAAALVTAAIATLLTSRLTPFQMIAAAVLSALAFLITIKSVFFLPAYLGVLILRIKQPGMAVRIIFSGILCAAIVAALYHWHASGMTTAPGRDTATTAQSALRVTLLQTNLLPRIDELALWFLLSIGSIVLIWFGLRRTRNWQEITALLLFAGPLWAVIIYRNAYPYYFPFAVPLLMVAAAIGAQWLSQTKWLTPLLGVLVLSATVQTILAAREGATVQKATLAEVHRLFPDPVPYIDSLSMVSSFPSAGFFTSTWGMTRYRNTGTPVFAEVIARDRPPMLIANSAALRSAMRQTTPVIHPQAFLPEDQQTLAKSFVHYNGAIWLAGAETTLSEEAVVLDVPFPGTYRIETTEEVLIDNASNTSGRITLTDKTSVSLEGPAGAEVRLIWDTQGDHSAAPLPEGRLFYNHWRLP